MNTEAPSTCSILIYLLRAASQMKVGLKGRGIEQKKLVSNNTWTEGLNHDLYNHAKLPGSVQEHKCGIFFIHTYFLNYYFNNNKKTLLYVLALVCVCRLVSRSKPECRTLVTAASFWSKRPELCRSPRLTVLLSGSSLIVPVQSQRRYCSVNKMGPPYLIKNTLCFF